MNDYFDFFNKLERECKVIYDKDSFSYFKSEDVKECLKCGQWFDDLWERDQKVFLRIADKFDLGSPKEYLNAVDFILDVEQKTTIFY